MIAIRGIYDGTVVRPLERVSSPANASVMIVFPAEAETTGRLGSAEDPVEALFGSGRGENLVKRLLESRREERSRQRDRPVET